MLLLSVIAGVRIDVLLSFQGNDMMTSFQAVAAGLGTGDDAVKNSGKDGFWFSIVVFAILATIHVARVMLDLFLMQRFMLRWRAWLTDRLTGDWLDGKAYYRARFIDDTIDNPDQRIQQRHRHLHRRRRTAAQHAEQHLGSDAAVRRGLVDHVDDLVHRDPVEPVGHADSADRRIRAFRGRCSGSGWSTCSFATVIAFWIGRPIIWLSFNNEKFNAAFRYALVRLRDASEAVAFYRGEVAERTGLRRLFAPVVANYKRYVNRMIGFYGWNLSMSQIIVPLPYMLAVSAVLHRRDQARRHDPVRVGVRQHPGRPVVLP